MSKLNNSDTKKYSAEKIDSDGTDFNVNNYTKKQLYKILGFSNTDRKKPSHDAIRSSIKDLKNSTRDLRVVDFLTNAQNKLLSENGNLDTDMFQTEYTKTRDDNSANFRTDRFQQVTTLDDENENFVMFRNKLNIASTKITDVLQGSINPNLKNVVERIVNIDSQFRKSIYDKYGSGGVNTSSTTTSTNFVMEFTEHMTNVISMKLHSYSIPTTWYVFSKKLGNTCLEIADKDSIGANTVYDGSSNELPYCDCIEDGNPRYSELNDNLNETFGTFLDFEFIRSKGKMKITNKTDKSLRIYFYRPAGFGSGTVNNGSSENAPCGRGCSTSGGFSNNNLGWNLGFKPSPDIDTGEVYIDLDASGTDGATITSPSIVDINGPKYFTLSIDDFNQNHINKGMVNVLDREETLSLPSYYNPVEKDYLKNDTDNSKQDDNLACNELSNKKNAKTPYVRKNTNKPRTLTAAQIYSINEIITSRHKPVTRIPTPGISNTFAHINLTNIRSLVDEREPITAVGTNLIMNSRSYFGPVHIRRLRVTLYDDKGNIVDLNGHDWCFTLIIDMLYQY